MTKEPSPNKDQIKHQLADVVGRWLHDFQTLIQQDKADLLKSLLSPNLIAIGMEDNPELIHLDSKTFQFEFTGVKIFWSHDWLTSVVITEWRCGIKNGRVTLVLQAYPADSKVLCMHYHFSETPVNKIVSIIE